MNEDEETVETRFQGPDACDDARLRLGGLGADFPRDDGHGDDDHDPLEKQEKLEVRMIFRK